MCRSTKSHLRHAPHDGLKPKNPGHYPHLLHQVMECSDFLPLLVYHYILYGEENLKKIKAKDILVSELSESLDAMLDQATYSIFKGNAWGQLTYSSRWYRGMAMVRPSNAGIPTGNRTDTHRWGMASSS